MTSKRDLQAMLDSARNEARNNRFELEAVLRAVRSVFQLEDAYADIVEPQRHNSVASPRIISGTVKLKSDLLSANDYIINRVALERLLKEKP